MVLRFISEICAGAQEVPWLFVPSALHGRASVLSGGFGGDGSKNVSALMRQQQRRRGGENVDSVGCKSGHTPEWKLITFSDIMH